MLRHLSMLNHVKASFSHGFPMVSPTLRRLTSRKTQSEAARAAESGSLPKSPRFVARHWKKTAFQGMIMTVGKDRRDYIWL